MEEEVITTASIDRATVSQGKHDRLTWLLTFVQLLRTLEQPDLLKGLLP